MTGLVKIPVLICCCWPNSVNAKASGVPEARHCIQALGSWAAGKRVASSTPVLLVRQMELLSDAQKHLATVMDSDHISLKYIRNILQTERIKYSETRGLFSVRFTVSSDDFTLAQRILRLERQKNYLDLLSPEVKGAPLPSWQLFSGGGKRRRHLRAEQSGSSIERMVNRAHQDLVDSGSSGPFNEVTNIQFRRRRYLKADGRYAVAIDVRLRTKVKNTNVPGPLIDYQVLNDGAEVYQTRQVPPTAQVVSGDPHDLAAISRMRALAREAGIQVVVWNGTLYSSPSVRKRLERQLIRDARRIGYPVRSGSDPTMIYGPSMTDLHSIVVQTPAPEAMLKVRNTAPKEVPAALSAATIAGIIGSDAVVTSIEYYRRNLSLDGRVPGASYLVWIHVQRGTPVHSRATTAVVVGNGKVQFWPANDPGLLGRYWKLETAETASD